MIPRTCLKRYGVLRDSLLRMEAAYVTRRSFVSSLAFRNTSSPSQAPKVFQAASFAQPKEPQAKEQKNVLAPEVPQEDIDDFNITKLVHGKTDMKIAITKRASDKLTKIAKDDHNPDAALRISVESGGCHGFQYNLSLTDLKKELKEGEEDVLVFKRDEGDSIAQVVINESSLQILQDSKIDFTKELIGSSFKVVDSPYTSTACGCGASFDFDFEKLAQKKSHGES
ncbi:Piso0_002565 [Millerozyma farinosa CBS 7064]|uniref:Piso0_002565 protein n=1 Tax=Pichia sorbitophila (strain ATCC MYA-4447 / BCRC 22081 / CBS 7064 / NBRC 10061 / NRRL Y-12695) TaxID=559304 RepID=G8YFD7_PICSO|nr:Piso0_002565 [Millerozyma farinosa CBS 7064]